MSPYTEALLVMGSTGTLELVCEDSTLRRKGFVRAGVQPALALG